MFKIWKYVIEGVGAEFGVPQNGKVLTIQMQRDVPTLWILVDPDAPKEKRRFVLVGTGLPIKDPEGMEYVGSVQEHIFVWHIFEIKKKV